ncbi:MAG: PilZ domain-containing protein [Lachnospiraceae bacterium]|nr:PilZ domain-containing protein [Lachnospiraceae bacterium]MBQ4300031.1 PilZ domain-containing protein [Lachnospiraceae bacterium]
MNTGRSITLEEIEKDDDITIRAYNDDCQIELKAIYSEINPKVKDQIAAATHSDNFVPIEMVNVPNRKDAVVLFADANCSLEALINHKGQLYKFENVIVPRAKIDKKDTIQLIMGNHPGVRYNRRNAYRVPLGLDGKLVLDKGMMNIIIRDISETGVGIIVPNALEVDRGQDVRILFSDYIYVFDLKSRIVREEKISDTHKVIGLALYPMKSNNVERYIAKKQVEKQVNSVAANA